MSASRFRRVAGLAAACTALAAPVALADRSTGEGAALQHAPGDGLVDTGVEAAALSVGTHAQQTDHLPPVRDDIELVSKLKLTDVEGGIADVAALGEFAYLAAWSPECSGSDPASKGGGVHVVDVSDPAAPKKVAFAPAPPNTYVGEGVHAFHMETTSFKGDVLLMNHEGCDTAKPYPGGFSAYDVTDPRNPKPLAFGAGEPKSNPDPNVLDASTSHSAHSVQGWWTGTNAYAVVIDNQDLRDIDIFDITDPKAPKLISETGFEQYPQVHTPLENGNTVFIHDAQVKQINGRWLMQVSYWDAGYITLDVTDPANPTYVADSDPPRPDPLSGQAVPEGNAHQSYWSHDNRYIIAADEDFSPFRTLFQITTGPHQGPQSAGEFGWTVPIDQKYPNGVNGPTIYGGTGCPEDADGNGTSDRDQVPPASELQAAAGEAKVVVFTRGTCFFSQKVESGQLKGYDVVLVGNSHVGSRNGLLPEAFICGSKGHDFTPTVSGLCVGHKAMHDLFEDPPNYTGGFNDIEIGSKGAKISATTVFDGWGPVHLLDANTLQEVDQYAVDEAYDQRFASGFGDLSVHETKTDPTENIAYVAYYSAGVRVVRFGADGFDETGAFIDDGSAFNGAPASGTGNDIWGIAPVTARDQQRYILASDRSYGLYVLRYTGPGAPQPPACADATVRTDPGTPVRVPLTCTDANNNPLVRTIVDGPDNGTIRIDGDAAVYTPRAGFAGTDVFTFRAFDGAAFSPEATVRVIVPAAGRCANPLLGTTGNDLLNGTELGDAIRGGAGSDVMAGLQGDDCLYGEAGNDRLGGGAGNDVLHGGEGRDRLFADSGDDELRGDAGVDHLRGSSGNDRVYGSVGNDYVSGGSNDDYVSGGRGNDSMRGESGRDRMFGGAGHDAIDVGPGKNGASGGSGNDRIDAANGSKDNINCGSGRDLVRADAVDQVDRSCETVKRTRTTRKP